jgi:spartin
MVRGAVRGSELIFHGADYLKTQLAPEANARAVDPRVQQGLAAAAWASQGACRVSGWLVSRVGQATMALGRLAAPHLERGANRALTHLTSQSAHESSSQLRIVGEVASGTVAAVSTMYMALENSSKILAKNIANNTVMIVSHKYGTDMAVATDSALSTAGNSYLTFYNAAALGAAWTLLVALRVTLSAAGPKGIAKRAAKDTGKAFIGVDMEQVAARARVVPDQDQLVSAGGG